jgi:ribosomal protein S18 acetylase RimI-like enzyme
MTDYRVGEAISPEQFIDVLRRSSLADRRPVDDPDCVAGMLRHADLVVTAWQNDQLVGVARSVTDFTYCCYLSDLAVDQGLQRAGIGRELIRKTREQLGARCTIILLSAPAATDYYPRMGFTRHASAWVLLPGDRLT